MKYAKSFTELIGKTPLLELTAVEESEKLSATVLAKLEYFNPAGSVKDRTALFMISDAEKTGKLKSGATIIEPTSGNTGIGLAAIAVARGYKIILTMPDTMSLERRKLLAAYGARIELTPGAEGMKGAIAKAEELNREIPGSVIMGQFVNPANIEAHYRTTGPEIWADTDGKVDIYVAGIGTGGTLTGTAKFLKEKNPAVKIVGVEPKSSPVITEGRAGAHKIQGIGANFVPEIFDSALCDEVADVSDEDAYRFTKLIAQREGVLVGISSGAAVFEAAELAKKPENKDKIIVALLPDGGERYLSSGVFD